MGRDYVLDASWLAILADLGLDAERVAARAGLDEELPRGASVRLPSGEFFKLWRAFEAEADDPILALRLASTMDADVLSPLVLFALCSTDLHTALKRIGRYKPVLAPIRHDVYQGREGVSVTLSWDTAPPPPSLVHFELLFMVALARRGTRTRIRPVSLSTTQPPEPAAPYADYLGVDISQGRSHSVTFALEDAQRRFLTANERMWATYEQEIWRMLTGWTGTTQTTESVRAVLVERMRDQSVTVASVARELAVSPRTLQRRLQDEGTSFQEVLQDLRVTLARRYLEHTRLPASEIGAMLGYAEPNSFYRAFQAWTGITPEGFRNGAS